MIKIKLKEKIKLQRHFSLHHGVHQASTTHSDLCYRIQHGVTRLKNGNQKIESRWKIEIKEKIWSPWNNGISEKYRNRECQNIEEKDFFSSEEWSIPSGLNIIVWIMYVYCSVNITRLRSQVRTKFFLYRMSNLALILRKHCHTPLPKIYENRVGDESWRCIYSRRIPHLYTLSLK